MAKTALNPQEPVASGPLTWPNIFTNRVESSGSLFFSLLLVLIGSLGILLVTLKSLLPDYESLLTSRSFVVALVLVSALVSGVAASPMVQKRLKGLDLVLQSRQDLLKFALIVGELAVLVLIFRLFELENAAFYETLALLTFCGFLVHHFLPATARLPFFVGLSLLGLVTVLGVANGLWVIGLVLGFVILARLPLAWAWRVGLMVAAGVGLVLLRVNLVPAPWSVVVWPVVGSILMFRLILYVYELKHAQKLPGWTQTLAYFFLLPNVIFPLFPVVDFAAFRRTYFDAEAYGIYQRGIRWMLRGTVYLILYRVLYYDVVLAPADVQNAGDLLRYLVSNYLLILRILGQFDLIVGMLHLFGFNLPPANYLNFYASSFTDFWRRANIYWKDFMLKVFYYPAYFQVRRWGLSVGLVIATVFVFVVTWVLHAYQWFWILGTYPVSVPDSMFWGLFGVLMVGNLLYENQRGRKRALGKRWDAGQVVGQGLRMAGMFGFICVLWSLWTSASLEEWLSLWRAAVVMPPLDGRAIVTGVVGAAVFLLIYTVVAIEWDEVRWGGFKSSFVRAAGATAILAVAIYLLGNPILYLRLPTPAQALISDLKVDRLNQPDANLLTRGYYENILSLSRTNSQVWQIYSQKEEKDVWINETEAIRNTGDYMEQALRPSVKLGFRGKVFQTNQWGMRDREYTLAKPVDTYRIALIGSSYVMGSGVGDDETFDNLVEDRLNRDDSRSSYKHFELLNFGVASYSTAQEYASFDNEALRFNPDAALFFQTSIDSSVLVRYVARVVYEGISFPFSGLQQIAVQAGVKSAPSEEEAIRRLTPHELELTSWVYNQFARDAQSHRVRAIWVYLPAIGHVDDPAYVNELTQLARGAGFEIIDLTGVFPESEWASLQVASWDTHPNAGGHELIANRLYGALHQPEIWQSLGLAEAK